MCTGYGMAAEKIKIKVESPTSEFYVKMKEIDTVEDLMNIVKKTWGDDGSFTLRHYSELMENEKPLSAYNVKDGDVIKAEFFVEP
ncbi:hypothetical protein BUALT_Bualt08G0134600 [Buddleja alternifolia]|uniref:Ubiquitin-like domain-containing protein n=1 Tax=Buddleja alternifolia TaxID=168488 RepID=A0AAV6X6G8_9LAMI|nr:hypothetical protein BUALT_Bualt08G0134600 [Buddleja alternifolia]